MSVQPLSIRNYIKNQEFKNNTAWWNNLRDEQLFTENAEVQLDAIGEEDEDLICIVNSPSGVHMRRLPSLAETENDEQYFDS